jgi:hypothetical protein
VLLEHHVLAVARAWRVRERVEQEAAQMFATLAGGLRELGLAAPVVALAEKAAADERDHAIRCRRIVDAHAPGLEPFAVAPPPRLGPPSLTPRQRTIYEAVALCCVTETLSVALLGTMRDVVKDELVADTVSHILRDEIDHARIGWAVLAATGGGGGHGWLAPHIAGMVRAALRQDEAMVARGEDLSAYGILTRPQVDDVVRQTLDHVILPGLRQLDGVALR